MPDSDWGVVLMWQLHPATEADIDTLADDLASVVWEIRRRLAGTEHFLMVADVCDEFGIDLKEAA